MIKALQPTASPTLAPPPADQVATAARVRKIIYGALAFLSLLMLLAPLKLLPDIYWLRELSKYMALAILALSIDLIWGYTGMLSLGQGLFFGLGAYAVAYSLTLQKAAAVASDEVTIVLPGTVPPQFMEYTGLAPADPDYKVPGALAWIAPLANIWVALAVAILLPMLVGLIFGLFSFRPKIRSLGRLAALFLPLAGGFLLPLVAFWWGPLSDYPIVAAVLIALPLLALLFGLIVRGQRIQGVYFALLTQAVLLLAFTLIRNQQRVTGGVVGIKDLSEFQVVVEPYDISDLDPVKQFNSFIAEIPQGYWAEALQLTQIKRLYPVIAAILMASFCLCALLMRTKFGKILTAIRDSENRVQALGYNTALYKTFVFTLAAGFAGLAGALYVAANGLADPGYLSITESITMVVWVAVGGRGNLFGALVGTILVNFANDYISPAFPHYWTIILGAMFVSVVVLMPRGLVGAAGRGAFFGTMLGILEVDWFVKWVREALEHRYELIGSNRYLVLHFPAYWLVVWVLFAGALLGLYCWRFRGRLAGAKAWLAARLNMPAHLVNPLAWVVEILVPVGLAYMVVGPLLHLPGLENVKFDEKIWKALIGTPFIVAMIFLPRLLELLLNGLIAAGGKLWRASPDRPALVSGGG